MCIVRSRGEKITLSKPSCAEKNLWVSELRKLWLWDSLLWIKLNQVNCRDSMNTGAIPDNDKTKLFVCSTVLMVEIWHWSRIQLCVLEIWACSLHVFKIPSFVMQLFIVYITRIRCINKYRVYTVYSPVQRWILSLLFCILVKGLFVFCKM